MANSRELVECMAELTGEPVSRVTGYMRDLRDADQGLVKVGGRGPGAARMTSHDAAALLCSIYGSGTVQGSADALLDFKKVSGTQQRRLASPHNKPLGPVFALEIERPPDVVDALAAAIDLVSREDELRQRFDYLFFGEAPLFARFELQLPGPFASLAIGVRGRFSEIWTFGQRGDLDSRHIHQCTEITLRKIAARLAA